MACRIGLSCEYMMKGSPSKSDSIRPAPCCQRMSVREAPARSGSRSTQRERPTKGVRDIAYEPKVEAPKGQRLELRRRHHLLQNQRRVRHLRPRARHQPWQEAIRHRTEEAQRSGCPRCRPERPAASPGPPVPPPPARPAPRARRSARPASGRRNGSSASTSRTRISSSRSWICRLSGGCVMFSRRAARPKWSSSAKVTKLRT
jgi:hypothetical protein